MSWTNKTNPSVLNAIFPSIFNVFEKDSIFPECLLEPILPKIPIKCLFGSLFLHDLVHRKELFKKQNCFRYFLLKVNFEWWCHRWLENNVITLGWWRPSQRGVRKCYEQRISITWNENRRYKTMTTDYSYLYNQIFLVFIHPKITCQLAMTNDWELLI